MKILYTEDGIEIDHGDRDISLAFRNGVVQVGIGENYLGVEGYERWTDIDLTLGEAAVLRDWLAAHLQLRLSTDKNNSQEEDYQ